MDGKTVRPVKILMIHGYTQSGPLFRAKTRALEKLLAKALVPLGLAPELIYPTGPIRLIPADLPGPDNDPSAPAAPDAAPAEAESYAWFRRDDATGAYLSLPEGMRAIAAAIRGAGGVDGVLGFSQGGAAAGIVAAAMEPGRTAPADAMVAWVAELRAANAGQPLRFAVSYSGFPARDPDLAGWCYHPPIATPTLHFIGTLDTVVEEARSQALALRCCYPVIVFHPGGHHVPVAKRWATPLITFIRHQEEEPDVPPGRPGGGSQPDFGHG